MKFFRIRRVKCDEGKPSCRRCTSTGRKCDGYEQVIVSSGEEASKNVYDSIQCFSPNQALLISPSRASMGLTGEESIGFDFFRKKTVFEIQGCFRSCLWESLVLQLSHQEPSILHAAIAVGSIHRKLTERDGAPQIMDVEDPRQLLGLRQYVKAIGFLRTRINDLENQDSGYIALITCLLFICLEMLRGQRLAALSHLGTGLRILSSRAVSVGSSEPNALILKHDSQSIQDQLISVFARLDYESTMFGQRSPHFLLLPSPTLKSWDQSIPSTFSSLSEARQYLDSLASRVLRFRGQLLGIATETATVHNSDLGTRICWEHATTRSMDLSIHPTILAELRCLQDDLAVWSSALEAFKGKSDASEPEKVSKRATLLEIQHFYIYFLMSTCQSSKEKTCDSFDPLFKKIVSLASIYLQDSTTITPNNDFARPIFTLESGVLPSLYLTAMKCRCPRTRRQAASLMSRASCQEGMWEGTLIAQFVERIADLEEARVNNGIFIRNSSDVSEEARCCDVVLAASEDPTCGKLICARYCHESDGGLVVWEQEFPLKG